jgi:hypothetical protein
VASAIDCRYAAFLSSRSSHLKIYKEQIWSDRSMSCVEGEGHRRVPGGTRAGSGATRPVARSEAAGKIVNRHGDHACRLRLTAGAAPTLTR